MRQLSQEHEILARSYGMKLLSGNPWRNPAFDWHQFLAVTEGCLEVTVSQSKWKVSAGQGLWIPSGQIHTITTLRPSDLRVIYVKEALKSECSVLMVNSLLRELIVRASKPGKLASADELEAALYRLTAEEIRNSPALPLDLTWPQSAIARSAATLLATGVSGPDIRLAASQVGVCRRTLERRFLAEVGIGAAEWRREWRLIEASRRVMEGDRVSDIAFDLGYSGSSALIEAFRRKFGASPGKFRTSYR